MLIYLIDEAGAIDSFAALTAVSVGGAQPAGGFTKQRQIVFPMNFETQLLRQLSRLDCWSTEAFTAAAGTKEKATKEQIE